MKKGLVTELNGKKYYPSVTSYPPGLNRLYGRHLKRSTTSTYSTNLNLLNLLNLVGIEYQLLAQNASPRIV